MVIKETIEQGGKSIDLTSNFGINVRLDNEIKPKAKAK